MLEQMSGPLCEAVLEGPGAAAVLAELARSDLLLVPLDRRGVWYRYHHLFRDMLLAELERAEPGLLRPCAGGRPPGAWPTGGPADELAVYSIAAGDVDAVAQLRARLAAEQVPSAAGASFLTAAELRVLPHAGHPPVVPGDRGPDVRVAAHREVAGRVAVPETGRVLASQGVARSRELGLLDR